MLLLSMSPISCRYVTLNCVIPRTEEVTRPLDVCRVCEHTLWDIAMLT